MECMKEGLCNSLLICDCLYAVVISCKFPRCFWELALLEEEDVIFLSSSEVVHHVDNGTLINNTLVSFFETRASECQKSTLYIDMLLVWKDSA